MRVTKHWNRLPRGSPSMEIFMISLQVGWTWSFLKDLYQLKVYDSVIMDLLALGSYTVVWDGSCCWYHCLCQLCHHACLTVSSSSRNSSLLLLPDIVGLESIIAHPDRIQLWQYFPPNPCVWVWQIPKFASSEGNSLLMLFSSLKSRGRKSDTMSFLKNFVKTKLLMACSGIPWFLLAGFN